MNFHLFSFFIHFHPFVSHFHIINKRLVWRCLKFYFCNICDCNHYFWDIFGSRRFWDILLISLRWPHFINSKIRSLNSKYTKFLKQVLNTRIFSQIYTNIFFVHQISFPKIKLKIVWTKLSALPLFRLFSTCSNKWLYKDNHVPIKCRNDIDISQNKTKRTSFVGTYESQRKNRLSCVK
jgi:hypothetical protein